MMYPRFQVAAIAACVAALLTITTAVAQTPGTTTPVATQAPSPTPALPPQTSVPGHPLQVVFGQQPAGTTSFGGPDTTGLPSLSGGDALRREFGNLVPTEVPGFTLGSATASGGRDRFSASIVFLDDPGRRTLKIGAWTKTGAFVMVVPANSPVSVVRQTTIGPFWALTVMPSPAVVGGAGPRDIVLTDGKTIWSMELYGFTDDAVALKLAEEIVVRATQPGPPATGDGTSRPGETPITALIFGALAMGFAATLLVATKVRPGRTVQPPAPPHFD